MKQDLLLDEKWYSPEELDLEDLELGGELLEEAARELREQQNPYLDENLGEDTEAIG